MKAIKREIYEQLKEWTLTEIESIPGKYSRQRIKEYHKILRNLIENETECEFIEDCEVIGKFIVYTTTANLGTKRWPDVYKRVDESHTTVQGKTPKQCQIKYCKINDSRILCAIIE